MKFPLNLGPDQIRDQFAVHTEDNHLEAGYLWNERAYAFTVTPDPQYKISGVARYRYNCAL